MPDSHCEGRNITFQDIWAEDRSREFVKSLPSVIWGLKNGNLLPQILPPISLSLFWNSMNLFICVATLKAYTKMKAWYLEGNELNPYQLLIFPPEFLPHITTSYLAGFSKEALQDRWVTQNKPLAQEVGHQMEDGHSEGTGRLLKIRNSPSNTFHLFCNSWPSWINSSSLFTKILVVFDSSSHSLLMVMVLLPLPHMVICYNQLSQPLDSPQFSWDIFRGKISLWWRDGEDFLTF